MIKFNFLKFSIHTAFALLCLITTNAMAADLDFHHSTATVKQGMLNGDSNNGVNRFLGIPYAQAPVGELRWQPPKDPLPWLGSRNATQFGNACAQIGNFYTSNDPRDFDHLYGSEDCLYLNIWAPQQARTGRPIVVFLHGGSAVHGAASLALYDGQRLAEELDAVVVTINYRLGFLGSVHLAALRSGDPTTDSGSFALLDQIKALEWVKQNAEAIGGDPANVTLMGHSAGCGSIWSLMQSPLASEKFQKIICLSGIPGNGTPEKVAGASHKLLANLLISDGLIKTLDELAPYLARQSKSELHSYLYNKSATDIIAAAKGIPVTPGAVDGYVIPQGNAGPLINPVPAFIGVTHDEAPMLFLHGQGAHDYTGLWKLIHSEDKLTQGDFFAGRYQLIKHKVTSWIADIYLHHLVDKAADLLADSSVPVYRYYFDWSNTPEPWKSLIGAYHGIDVPFVFGNFGIGTQNFTHFTWGVSEESERELIHQQLASSIRGFIESSDPNKYAAELNWQKWGSSTKIGIHF